MRIRQHSNLRLCRAVAAIHAGTLMLMPAAAETGIYSLGHGDLRVHLSGGQLHQRIHLGSESIMDGMPAGNAPFGVEYAPEDVNVLVPEPTLPRPAGAEWDFVGTAPGNPVWFIPEVQEFDRPWLGYSTQSLLRTEWSNFRMFLVEMSAPVGGHFSLIGSGGPFFAQTFFATSDGITAADSFDAPQQTHAHYSWLFTQPGNYALTLQFSGTHQTAGAVSSTATYRFAVVPEPSTTILLASAGVNLLRRQRHSKSTQAN